MKKYRILIAKPGLDGHDRGAKVVAHALRDAGFEVIYTGLRQTPEQIVKTAIQEDVDLIGLSILSGAHLQLSKKVIELMKKEGIASIPVFVGGIIPPDDVPKLLEIGVARVFGPGTPLSKIVQEVREVLEGWRARVNHKQIAKFITLIENEPERARQVLKDLPRKTCPVIGFTGSPGVGKSTLIDQVIARLRSMNKTVAVVAVDPSSPFSQGAFLGDRVRMKKHFLDEGVFIRSMASAAHSVD